MEHFCLQTQICGLNHQVVCSSDGFGIQVILDGRTQSVQTVAAAIRVANEYLGPELARARRTSAPWGLKVSVNQVAAVYGEWPLIPTRQTRTKDETLVSRIYRRWTNNDPVSALDNAIEIIRAYSPRTRLAA